MQGVSERGEGVWESLVREGERKGAPVAEPRTRAGAVEPRLARKDQSVSQSVREKAVAVMGVCLI